MHELVALDLDGGPDFVDAMRRVWDDGDAVLPLDRRAPARHTSSIIDALRPASILGPDGDRSRLEGPMPVEAGDAVVIATSGTTGRPKGVVHTHAAVEYAGFVTATALGVGGDVGWLACLPLSHVGGLSVITRALVAGASLEVIPRPEPGRIDAAARHGLTHVSLVPALLDRIDASLWRRILLGGSAIPQRRPPNSVATYGMTETFGGVVYDGLALNGVSIRIAATDDSTATDPGEPRVGPIEINSPTALRCYRDGSDPKDSRGWFRTGDLGSIDPTHGRLTVAGRADDLIITGGEKVWPADVEAVLRGDHRVRDIAVIGVDDPVWGQRVVAVVVPDPGADPPPADELRALVREQLPIACAPREVVLMEQLPRTALGKVERAALGHQITVTHRSEGGASA